jgi:hypothetical protein
MSNLSIQYRIIRWAIFRLEILLHHTPEDRALVEVRANIQDRKGCVDAHRAVVSNLFGEYSQELRDINTLIRLQEFKNKRNIGL